MKVLLPVGGKGTRLRPHTHTKSKSLVHVAGKPVLEHIINRLFPIGASQYIFIVDENGGQIVDFMQATFPSLSCQYVVQHERKGPAHAVALAIPYVEPGDDLLVVFNDTIFDADLTLIHELCVDCDGLIYSKVVEDYQRFGVNVLREDGTVADMIEKPETLVSKLAQVGLYYLKNGVDFMEYLKQSISACETVKGEYYLPAVFMRMIRDGKRLRAPEIDAWLDCGTPETLLQTNSYLLAGRHHNHGEVIDSVLIEPVHIEKGAVVRGSILGPNVSIAKGSIIEASILEEAIVNINSRVKRMVLTHSILGGCVHVEGSIRRMNIGDHCVIESVGTGEGVAG
jgi:glucose-1-phosphate thymidylyltransferase